MDGIERIYNRETGEESWTFLIGSVRYNCESWDGVLEILREQTRLERERGTAAAEIAARGYGTGTYNGD